MKIVIPGGTGQVGTILDRALTAAGHEVVVLTRTARSASAKSAGTGRRSARGPRRSTAATS